MNDHERYTRHLRLVDHWLAQAEDTDRTPGARECIALAQVHATIAQAVATANLAFSGIRTYTSEVYE